MDSARQVIRWSMPGWVFLFWLAAFQAIQKVCVSGSVVDAIKHSALSQLTPGAAAILIGSGVPLGFLIYQLYYHMYDHWMPFSFGPQDRGGDIIRCLSSHTQTELRAYEPDLDIKEMCELVTIPLLSDTPRLKREHRNRRGKNRYRNNRQVNFEVIRFYLTVISAEVESDSFKQEYTNLSDIYNAIGASRTALILSFVLYLLYNFLSPSHRAELFAIYAYPALINFALFTWAFAIIQSRRTRTGIACQAILSHTMTWYTSKKETTAAAVGNSTILWY